MYYIIHYLFRRVLPCLLVDPQVDVGWVALMIIAKASLHTTALTLFLAGYLTDGKCHRVLPFASAVLGNLTIGVDSSFMAKRKLPAICFFLG